VELSEQIVSLKLSKPLKELGVKQESLFYWVNGELISNENFQNMDLLERILFSQEVHEYYSAFTVSELGGMLPDWTETVKRMKDDWVCIIRHKHNDINDYSFGETEANARAKMLIYLLENKLMELPNEQT